MSLVEYYLITITSCGKGKIWPSFLYEMLRALQDELSNANYNEFSDLIVYERSSRLHLHTYMSVTINRFKLLSIIKKINTPNIFIHVDRFPYEDLPRVRDYILKQVPNYQRQHEILTEYYYETQNYFFDHEEADDCIYYDYIESNVHPIRC